jgi:hypothetical protein
MRKHLLDGFLLWHILVVVMVIAILSKLSVSTVTFVNRYVLRAELEKLYVLFFYLQQRAITCNQTQSLQFNVDSRSYTADGDTHVLPRHVAFGVLPHSFGPPGDPKHALTHPITYPSKQVHFYPDGTISAGTVYMIDANAQYMYALTSAVAQVSYIRTYYYAQRMWNVIS